jgi:UDPglucose 6-dehydrogenase
MNIAVIGTGYVGLVTGTCFAETGNKVVCVDIDKHKVDKMKDGVVPIYEPQLDVLFERNIRQKRLEFTTDINIAVAKSDIIFLALPTPPGEDGSADLSYILGVADTLGKIITDYKVIIDKSTVPVGTADKVTEIISKNSKCDFDVVSNPEFLKEGFAVDDFMKPDRVVIGTTSERARKLMYKLYKPFVRQGNPIIFMDEKSAELTKYAANAFLATKITFMNEIANYCELIGADVDMIRKGIGTDSRIGNKFLFPGIGFGGSCFPKDVSALLKSGKESSYNFKIINSILEVNHKQKFRLVDKVKRYFGNDLSNIKIAMWGLAFKADTDDVRESASLYMIKELLTLGANISVFDPEAMNNVRDIFGDKIEYCNNQYETLENSDLLLIATEWSVFRNPDFDKMSSKLKNNIIFDGRNLYDIEDMQEKDFYYESIGRKTINNV